MHLKRAISASKLLFFASQPREMAIQPVQKRVFLVPKCRKMALRPHFLRRF